MGRPIYWMLGLVTLGAGAVIVWHFAAEPGKSGAEVVAAAPPISQPAPAVATVAGPDPAPAAAPSKTTTQLILDTASGDPATRAAAITALAEVPRAEALPVLARILINGEPQVDRVLALQSMRDLALNQGDADGAIRDAIRHVIYHGDDLSRAGDAQEAIEIIEESLQRQ
jgi:HEAT repeat protein